MFFGKNCGGGARFRLGGRLLGASQRSRDEDDETGVQPYFCDFVSRDISAAISKRVLELGEYVTEYIVAYTIMEVLARHLPSEPGITSDPKNVEDFLSYCAPVLSARYLAVLRARVDCFAHEVSGGSGAMADAFISEASFQSWLMSIVKAIVEKGMTLARSSCESECGPQMDGTGEDSGPIHQITLRGSTLKQAWVNGVAEFPFLKDAEWTPAEETDIHSYHGACVAMLEEGELSRLVQRKIGRVEGHNEMAPFECLQTSFSAARSLLSATFRNTIITAELDPSLQGSLLGNRWKFKGQGYSGVLLIQFSTHTTAPTGLTSMVLNRKDIERWAPAAKELHGNCLEARAWTEAPLARMRNNAGAGLTRWPDVIHAPERLETIDVLRSWTGPARDGLLQPPMWRSAHCSEEAVEMLNKGGQRVYAITFERESKPRAQRALRRTKALCGRVLDLVRSKAGMWRAGGGGA